MTARYALVGHPVAHSLSPVLYARFFATYGIDATYEVLDVPPERSAGLAAEIRALGLAGVNLTTPHKETLLPALDEADDAVRIARATNAVAVRDGRLVGLQTDGEGFCRALREAVGFEPSGARCAILGAGGAARAIAAALAERGARAVAFLTRSKPRGADAASHVASAFPETAFSRLPLSPPAFRRVARTCGLVVNATTPAAGPAIDVLDIGALPEDAIWADLGYRAEEPPARRACHARSLRFVDGLGMLVHQAALSFGRFTGIAVDPRTLEAANGDAIAARGPFPRG